VISSATVSQHRLACLFLLLISPGCSFDPPPLEGEPGGGPDARPIPDGGEPGEDARVPDANPGCNGTELLPELHIGGTLVPDGQQGPVVEVLLGDLVTISAAGSCGGDGALSYEWAITPDDIIATADKDPADGPTTFTVYPTAAGDYTVTLTVSAAGSAPVEKSALAIRAHAWQVADVDPTLSMGDVRDMAVGGGNLWIASGGGAFKLPLAGDPDAFARVEVSGEPVLNDHSAVFFDTGTNFLWLGRSPDEDGLWRLDTTKTPLPASVQISWTDALGGTAQTRDIAGFEGTIITATNDGITALDPGETQFGGRDEPGGQRPEALVTGSSRILAGSRQIYDLASGQQFDSGINEDDNKIRAMAIDVPREDLWVGSDDAGVASFDLRTNTPIEVYNNTNSGLGSNKVRALVVETDGPYAGDVWAATDKGVSRYIRARDTWLHMNENHGLAGHVDLKTLAIDTDQDRRVIYGGSTAGVVYIRKP
jgi:hypothetical protein